MKEVIETVAATALVLGILFYLYQKYAKPKVAQIEAVVEKVSKDV